MGSRVRLAPGILEGPLMPDEVGTVVENDHSSVPYFVRADTGACSGETYWYSANDVILADGSGRSGGAISVGATISLSSENGFDVSLGSRAGFTLTDGNTTAVSPSGPKLLFSVGKIIKNDPIFAIIEWNFRDLGGNSAWGIGFVKGALRNSLLLVTSGVFIGAVTSLVYALKGSD